MGELFFSGILILTISLVSVVLFLRFSGKKILDSSLKTGSRPKHITRLGIALCLIMAVNIAYHLFRLIPEPVSSAQPVPKSDTGSDQNDVQIRQQLGLISEEIKNNPLVKECQRDLFLSHHPKPGEIGGNIELLDCSCDYLAAKDSEQFDKLFAHRDSQELSVNIFDEILEKTPGAQAKHDKCMGSVP